MKIRLDFVTNSSSASFITIFGDSKVTKEIIEKYIKDNNISINDYTGFFTGQYIIDNYDKIINEFENRDWTNNDCIPYLNAIDPNKYYYINCDYTWVESDEDGYPDEDDVEDHYAIISQECERKYGDLFYFTFDQGSGRDG